ncbi:MAG: GNAT family N-acetyltransferase [Lachnospiraceae bacterium]|nr:GNAT family N-acetyltransferase [Lachnospiraceae bacterium]
MRIREPKLKTKRLSIQPMSAEEISSLQETTDNQWLKGELLKREQYCGDQSEERIWYAPWKVCLKSDRTLVGLIAFCGPQEHNAVEVLFDTFPAYHGNGYTSEALGRVVKWAFNSPEVFYVEAEATDHCHAAKKVLEKLEFKPDGVGTQGTRYVKVKSEPWVAVYMCFGMAIGCALGGAYQNMGIGVSLGICFGVAVGTAIDSMMKKNRSRKREAQKKVEI